MSSLTPHHQVSGRFVDASGVARHARVGSCVRDVRGGDEQAAGLEEGESGQLDRAARQHTLALDGGKRVIEGQKKTRPRGNNTADVNMTRSQSKSWGRNPIRLYWLSRGNYGPTREITHVVCVNVCERVKPFCQVMPGLGAPEVSQCRMTDMPSITVLSEGPAVIFGAMPEGRRTHTHAHTQKKAAQYSNERR